MLKCYGFTSTEVKMSLLVHQYKNSLNSQFDDLKSNDIRIWKQSAYKQVVQARSFKLQIDVIQFGDVNT